MYDKICHMHIISTCYLDPRHGQRTYLFQRQYRFVYMAVYEGACAMSKKIEGKDVMNHVPQMFTLNSSSGTTKLEDEFEVVISKKSGHMKFNTLRLTETKCRRFADDIFNLTFVKSDLCICIEISFLLSLSLQFSISKSCFQIMTWRRTATSNCLNQWWSNLIMMLRCISLKEKVLLLLF